MPPSALVSPQQDVDTAPVAKPASKMSFMLTNEQNNTPIDVPQLLVHGNKEDTLAIPSMPTYSSIEESRAEQKKHMAAAFRLFGRIGFGQGGAGHISLRDPGNPHLMWLNPFGKHYSLIQPEDLVLIDDDGYVIHGGNQAVANSAGVHIHLGLHKARPDINAACHAHSENGVAWSAFGRPIDMINQDSCGFVDDQAIVPFNGIVTASEEGARIAAALGQKKTCAILTNHGLLTVGQTVDEAAYRFMLLDKLCGIQLKVEQAEHAGVKKVLVTEDEARRNAQISSSAFFMYTNFQTELQNLERQERLEK